MLVCFLRVTTISDRLETEEPSAAAMVQILARLEEQVVTRVSVLTTVAPESVTFHTALWERGHDAASCGFHPCVICRFFPPLQMCPMKKRSSSPLYRYISSHRKYLTNFFMLCHQVVLSTQALQRIMDNLTSQGHATSTTADQTADTLTNVSETEVGFHVNARQPHYPDSKLTRFPVPEEKVPWEVFHTRHISTRKPSAARNDGLGLLDAACFSCPLFVSGQL